MFENFQGQDYSALNQGQGGYERLPDGKYPVLIESLKLGESKKGYPTIKARFSVVNGPEAGRTIYVNRVVLRTGAPEDGVLVRMSNEFLRSLGCGDVTLTTLSAYEQQINAISDECVRGQYKYAIELFHDKKGYEGERIVDGPAR